MPKSRKRGGAKAHRKRVQKRNEKLGIAKQKFQKMFSKMYETKMNELKEKFEGMSALTEDSSVDVLETKNETVVQEEKTESSSSESKTE